MDRTIDTSEYGLCIYSMDMFTSFLKREKIKSKKLLALFQKDKKTFLKLQEEGIWIPFPEIDGVTYVIKIKNLNEEFDDQWEKVLEYDGFNLEVKDGIWISDTGSFLKFDEALYRCEGQESIGNFGMVHYDSNKERWYTTINGTKVYSDVWCDIPAGKYLLTVRGYAKKDIVDRKAVNYGYQFELTEIEGFEGYKNPREGYEFNIGKILRARS